MGIRVNYFIDQPYKLKTGLHFATYSVMTPEQMEHVRPIDPVSTWHLLNENVEDAVYYISSLFKANRNIDQYEQYWILTPIQKQLLRELRNLEEAEKLNPKDDEKSRRKLLSNFDWKDSVLQQHEIKGIESRH